MGRSDQDKLARLWAEAASGSARSELIKLIQHRLREPLGPTLLVLRLLLRQESLSPQGIELIRMLQRCIKEEIRAIQELLTTMQAFIEELAPANVQSQGDRNIWRNKKAVTRGLI